MVFIEKITLTVHLSPVVLSTDPGVYNLNLKDISSSVLFLILESEILLCEALITAV